MPKCKKVTTSSKARQERYWARFGVQLHMFDFLFFLQYFLDQFSYFAWIKSKLSADILCHIH